MSNQSVLLINITYMDAKGDYRYAYVANNPETININIAAARYSNDLVISEKHFNVMVDMLNLNLTENYSLEEGLGVIKHDSPLWEFLKAIGALS